MGRRGLDKPLSARARRRLRIAACLMGRAALVESTPGDDWCIAVLEVIDRLPGHRRERLRREVDWVESYELAQPTVRQARGTVA
jgi:hypothetical protein